MKYLAVIFSVYVMVLTAMPCNDVHAANTNSVSLELVKQNLNPANDIDLCSPFCFCNCCQTLAQPASYNNFQLTLVVFDLTIPSLVQNEIESTISFWRPPKS